MKFLCDRCKTRYSIGDDRVRGKILKIRCKNCANVITVREGMTVAEEQPPERRMRPTTAAPMAAASAPAGSALASAFVAQMTAKPPPALEEEWYVSIDGDQSGPFSLADAQRWIANKPFDAELHCWSEGFDDWLLVDKVSHFRGLRKKPPAPGAPPPLPRAVPQRSTPQSLKGLAADDEPKPLFAATMASLEKVSPAVATLGMPPMAARTPANGIVPKANGTGPAARLNDSAPVPRIDSQRNPMKIPAVQAVPKLGAVPKRASTAPGVAPMSAGAKALAAAFDTSPESEPNESHTTVDTNAFNDEIATRAEPVATKRAFDRVDQIAEPAKTNGRHERADDDGIPDDDSMDIGEVSRVVKLADIAKMGGSAAPRKLSRPPLGRATGATPKLDPSALAAGANPALAAMQDDASVGENLVVAPVVAQAHRRGMIMLMGVAAVLLIGVAIAVVVIIKNSAADETGGGLGHTNQIDTSRPEEVVRAHMLPNEGSGAGSAVAQRPNTGRHFTNNPHPNGSNTPDELPGTGTKIKSEEIEDLAAKNSQGTQRCYMRAQRGAEGILIQDLKKLTVTITIDKTGAVSDVALSDHQADSLGTCLAGMIKRWKFRESPGGMYRFILAFAS